MSEESINEKFVDWLAKRMTKAGRGDDEHILKVDPSGKYWLGRLQPELSVMDHDLGDRGERLEPCAIGIKVKPKGNGPWKFTIQISFCIWLWYKEVREWRKSNSITLKKQLEVPTERGRYRYAQEELKDLICAETGQDGLSVRIEVEVEFGQAGIPELVISMVNCSPKKHHFYKDTRIYECSLCVSNLRIQPFILESLEDSFRYDRNVDAYGINCGVVSNRDGSLKTEDAITVDRPRPNYWNIDDPPPELNFLELSKDPISPAKLLLKYLTTWGEGCWSESALEDRVLKENWSPEMKARALKASEEFSEECLRIKQGINLLESNSIIANSFKLMNQAMHICGHGKYDSWRPFQFGFLLANINSVVNDAEETEIADVIWFATGGGKTETYLGLLITAAMYDRLTGKLSGVTAWSRFPLRMLSLQQTQRFADALAAAEIVRNDSDLPGDEFSLGFFVGQGATPNKIPDIPKDHEPDPDDYDMPARFKVLEYCPFCKTDSVGMRFNRLHWKLEHYCTSSDCQYKDKSLPVYVVDEEIYRFLPTVIVGTLDKAASISLQASMRGLVGAPLGVCSKDGHGFTYAPRRKKPSGCLVPGCRGTIKPIPMDAHRFGPSFRLQDELHLLRDSLGAVDSHYEALYDSLQNELCSTVPKILASSATLTGYKKQIEVLYRRSARVFPVPPPKEGSGFWTSSSSSLMRRFVAIAPKGVTIEYTVDRLLTELQIAIRKLHFERESTCAEIGIEEKHAERLVSLYGTNVVYGNTLRDLEAITRSMETQVLVDGAVNTASLTGKTDFTEVRETLSRLEEPELNFDQRLHIVSASSMMSHGVDVDRLNVMVILGLPLSAAEFIQATARVGRKYPGIVFVVHKIGRERDAGVFRSFKQFVEQGDRFVEPIPVTRRSRQVLSRTIAGLQLARILMIHEANAGTPLTTLRTFINYAQKGGFKVEDEIEALINTLKLDTDLDAPLKDDLIMWLNAFGNNISTPPSDAKFPSDLSPTGSPMLSLRDVETQVPVIGSQI